MNKEIIEKIQNSKHLVAFTGAGISVESGIPPFRGENGIWNKYDPKIFDIDYYFSNTEKTWQMIKSIFFEVIENVEPNEAHFGLAKLEKLGILKGLITQNIDNLHTKAGNSDVIEYHGNTRQMICTDCASIFPISASILEMTIPICSKCGGLLKPDFVFFGEMIPVDAIKKSNEHVAKADLMLIIGTTGVIYPASLIPHDAKQKGAKIIEINIEPSEYTNSITEYFLKGKATEVLTKIVEILV